MRGLLVAIMLLSLPALAREVRGRVMSTEDGSEAFKRELGNAYVLRADIATDLGDVVTINLQEGRTQVFEGSQPAGSVQAVRTGARIRAVVDDDCQLESGRCIASEVGVEKAGSLSRIEAMRENAAQADSELDKGMALGGHASGDPRDIEERDASCPEGMVAWMKDGERVLDTDGKPACRVKRQFIKGELTNLGSDKLVVADSRFGLRVGYAYLDHSSYLAIDPEIDLHFGPDVALGLGVPLHVLAYAGGFYDTGKIKLRKHDYDKPSQYARILRFLTIGKKEDPFYLNVSQLFAASIGHGAIVRRYSGNTDINITRVGAQLDAYAKFGGFEAFIGDVVQPTHFMAGLAFVKPLGWLSGPARETWGSTSLGISTAMDLEAPYQLQRDAAGRPTVGDDGEPIVSATRRAQLVGIDLETKVLKTDHADIKPYLDYSRLLSIHSPIGAGAGSSGGGGTTLGLLGRFNVGDVKVHAFRVVLEGRYFDGNYLPGYFDTFYEVQKYQFITGKADAGYEPKLWTILNRDRAHKRAGYYVEFGYQFNQGLGLMAAFEDSFHVAGPADICATCAPDLKYVGGRNLTLHIEYPAYSWLQFFASFYRRSFDGAPVDTGRPLGDNTLVYGAVRFHMLWIFFLNARVFRTWQADPVLGEMKNLWGGDVDLEIGYEFDRSTRPGRR